MTNVTYVKDRHKFPYLVWEDSAAIEQAKTHIEGLRQGYVRAIQVFNALDVGMLRKADIPALLTDPKDLVKQRCIALIGEAPTFGKFKLKQEVLIDQLELPDTTTLEQVVLFLNQQQSFRNGNIDLLTAFETQGEKVLTNEDFLKTLLDRYRVFANTETEIAAWLAYKAYIDAYNRLESHMKQTYHADGLSYTQRQQIFRTNTETGIVEFNPSFYQKLITP